MVIHSNVNELVRKGEVLYIEPPHDWDWSTYHVLLMQDLVQHIVDILRSRPEEMGEPEYPYGLMLQVLLRASIKEIIECVRWGTDIAVELHVKATRSGERVGIIEGIRACYAQIYEKAYGEREKCHSQHHSRFLDHLFANTCWKTSMKLSHVWICTPS